MAFKLVWRLLTRRSAWDSRCRPVPFLDRGVPGRPGRPGRALTELKLYLAAARSPELRPLARAWRDRLCETLTPLTGDRAAYAVAVFVDGVLLQHFAIGEPLDAAVESSIAALIRSDQPRVRFGNSVENYGRDHGRMVDEAVRVEIRTLGGCLFDSPLARLLLGRNTSWHYVDESDRVLLDDTVGMLAGRGEPVDELPSLEPGGPRQKIFFEPARTQVGIVTCGGLCPGLNNVIRALVLELTTGYGVRQIVRFRNGYQGLVARYGHPVVPLTPAVVDRIDEYGGTILGTARGDQDPRRSPTPSTSSVSTSCS
ncbi:6-phosphofructokinase [Solwaraspora sp. WMMB335]|uniref:6-phosphofructokinase n=1 Tax=Solwaraspora sp. WMMB335 TaxID=3404118 RepID=UPI003B959D45